MRKAYTLTSGETGYRVSMELFVSESDLDYLRGLFDNKPTNAQILKRLKREGEANLQGWIENANEYIGEGETCD